MLYKNMICLVIGIIIGVRLTDIWDYLKWQNSNTKVKLKTTTRVSTSHQNVTPQVAVTSGDSVHDTSQQSEESAASSALPLADLLFERTRVLCWIMTTPEFHLKRALHIRHTWGKRCNALLFMSTQLDPFLVTVKLNVGEGRSFLWDKTREAFRYVYENYFDEADWFLKADDDTYVIMENLRELLYQYSPEMPIYFGCKFHPGVQQRYMSGGAGYVLSKEALRRFVEVAYANATLCAPTSFAEDREMGQCMQNVGVVAGDSRDAAGQERFIPLAPKHLIPIDTSEWYAKYLFYKRDKRVPCCSRRAISFHYIKPKDFYMLDYILYNLRPFGLPAVAEETLPPKVNVNKVLQKARKDYSSHIFSV